MKNDPKCLESCLKSEQCSSYGRMFRDAREAARAGRDNADIYTQEHDAQWESVSSSYPACSQCSCSHASIMALLKEHEGSSEKMEAIRSRIEERDYRMAASAAKAMGG